MLTTLSDLSGGFLLLLFNLIQGINKESGYSWAEKNHFRRVDLLKTVGGSRICPLTSHRLDEPTSAGRFSPSASRGLNAGQHQHTHTPRWEILQRPGAWQRDGYNQLITTHSFQRTFLAWISKQGWDTEANLTGRIKERKIVSKTNPSLSLKRPKIQIIFHQWCFPDWEKL